jgi:hypothetical protein
MSQSYVQERSYAVNMPTSDIPQSMMDEKLVKPLPMTSSLVSCANQAGSQQNGGQLIFSIPANSTSFLMQNSGYLRFDLTITCSATGGTGCFANAASSASSLINRLTLQAGGNLIENIQQYGLMTHPMLLLNKTNQNYFNNDAFLQENAGGTIPLPQAGATSLSVSSSYAFPLAIGSFANHSWPLFLQSAPSILTLELQGSLAQAFTGPLITGYTISNAYFCYQNLQCDGQYIAAVRQSLAQGNLYTIPTVSYLGLTYGSGASISYNIGLNLSSVLAFLYTIIATPVNTAPCWHTGRSQTLAELYVDGRNISTLGLNMDLTQRPAQVFIESRRAFEALGDPLQSVITNDNYANTVAQGNLGSTQTSWQNSVCCLGFGGLNHCNEMGFSFTGTAVSNLSFRWTGSYTNGDVIYMSIPYSCCLLFDGTGNITKTI